MIDPSSVSSREDLAEFISLLRQDFHQIASRWENRGIESFLEALSAYLLDIAGYYRNNRIDVDPDKPSWRLFADALIGAAIYE